MVWLASYGVTLWIVIIIIIILINATIVPATSGEVACRWEEAEAPSAAQGAQTAAQEQEEEESCVWQWIRERAEF